MCVCVVSGVFIGNEYLLVHQQVWIVVTKESVGGAGVHVPVLFVGCLVAEAATAYGWLAGAFACAGGGGGLSVEGIPKELHGRNVSDCYYCNCSFTMHMPRPVHHTGLLVTPPQATASPRGEELSSG